MLVCVSVCARGPISTPKLCARVNARNTLTVLVLVRSCVLCTRIHKHKHCQIQALSKCVRILVCSGDLVGVIEGDQQALVRVGQGLDLDPVLRLVLCKPPPPPGPSIKQSIQRNIPPPPPSPRSFYQSVHPAKQLPTHLSVSLFLSGCMLLIGIPFGRHITQFCECRHDPPPPAPPPLASSVHLFLSII